MSTLKCVEIVCKCISASFQHHCDQLCSSNSTALGFAADIDNVRCSRGTCNLVLHFICLDLFLHYSKRLCFRPLNPHLDLIEIKVSHANLKLLLCNATKNCYCLRPAGVLQKHTLVHLKKSVHLHLHPPNLYLATRALNEWCFRRSFRFIRS
jgi:hypothetical protein